MAAPPGATQAKKDAKRVLSAFDDFFAELNGSSSQGPSTYTPAIVNTLKRKSSDERDMGGPYKKQALPEILGGEPGTQSYSREGSNRPATPPRRTKLSSELSINMEQLFPNSFQESPKRNQLGDPSTILAENEKIGPPLEEAMKALEINSINDYFPGLEIKLMKHQLIGVYWMLKQEMSAVNRGGVLADEMGLGKTIQIIGVMVVNQRDSDHALKAKEEAEEEEEEEEEEIVSKKRGNSKTKSRRTGFSKTTLIVAPASLLRQWKEEIETKCQEGLLHVHIQHGKYKLKTSKELRQYDVVIVSYQTLMAEFPTGLKDIDRADWLPEMGGPLARTKWYRIVLDEAQVVRNRLTQGAQCVFRLRAKYRWCLSGTPIFNTVCDIFPYLKFCRPGYYSWELFYGAIGRLEKRDAGRATAKANEWLKELMLRRTKQSRLDGRLILEDLPDKKIEIVELEFSDGERRIYDDMHAMVTSKIGEIVSRGLEEKYHMYILVLILRLRQICNHPCLYLADKNASDEPPEISAVEKQQIINKARGELGSVWVDEMKKKFAQKALQLTRLNADEGIDTCKSCHEPFTANAMLISCGHEICAECLADLEKSALQLDRDMEELDSDDGVSRPCPTCKKFIDPRKAYKSAAFEVSEKDLVFGGSFQKTLADSKCNGKKPKPTIILDSDEEDFPDADKFLVGIGDSKKSSKSPQKQISKELQMPTSTLSQANFLDHEDTRHLNAEENQKRWMNSKIASTKLIALINRLKEWECDTETAMDKVIVYSQWTTMLDIVEDLLEQYDIKWLRYDGKMGREDRDEAISLFKKVGGPKIILISIKSGSVGLNLTCSNRIINLDLSWSLQAEQQAYDRAHRIGQTKTVVIKRFVIRDTIESRILDLQAQKQEVAAAALGEGDAPMQRHSNALTARELTSLVMGN